MSLKTHLYKENMFNDENLKWPCALFLQKDQTGMPVHVVFGAYHMQSAKFKVYGYPIGRGTLWSAMLHPETIHQYLIKLMKRKG